MLAFASPTTAPLLEMRGISKSFPGVQALRDVSLALRGGEVLALLGENGAGKSTLMKILGGAQTPDAGSIFVDGREIAIRTPQDARRAGVAVIYQEFNLVPFLSARENIFLGREQTRCGFVRRASERTRTLELFARLGVDIDPETPCSRLSVAHQQAVEIAKALAFDARIIVMDEPTAALTLQEVDTLLKLVAALREQGIGIIYVSHRLEEIFRVCDRILVMRDGAHVATRLTSELNRQQLIEMMVGRKLENEFPRRQAMIGLPRLHVRNLCRGGKVKELSFDVRGGEVLALTGLVGAGRTETLRLIFGADRRDSGEISLDGKALALASPRDAIAAGICLLTEDRKAQGLVLGMSVLENFGLPNMKRFTHAGMIDRRRERDAFAGYVKQLRIRIPNDRQLAKNLSGGNQQKVVLAKWLASNSQVILFDEPTRGIDVGAKFEIYQLINELAAAGKAVVFVSSDLPEVLGMADRILVMHEGRLTGEIADVSHATQEQVMQLAVQ